MGYYTKFEMNFTGNATEADIVAALKEINPNYFDYDADHLDTLFEEEMKWYDATSDMIKLSERFPNVLFELSGKGEEYDDIWKEYYYNGVHQHCKGRIVFDEIDPAILGMAVKKKSLTAKEAYEIAKSKQQAFDSKVITAIDDSIEQMVKDGVYKFFMKITDIDSYDVSGVLKHYADLGYKVENKNGGIKLCWDFKTK